jgi:hypothetical protein
MLHIRTNTELREENAMGDNAETAILAGGCISGVQELLRHRDAVISTSVGYTGGENDNPPYRNHPGHAEAVEIVFDPERISYRFHAGDAQLVLSPGARDPIRFRVLLDGEAPGASRGVDVDEDGNGLLQEARMYQLVREHDEVRQRTLEITFLEPCAEAYASTFG